MEIRNIEMSGQNFQIAEYLNIKLIYSKNLISYKTFHNAYKEVFFLVSFIYDSSTQLKFV